MPDKYYETRKQWNSRNYKQINIAVRPELVEAFVIACERNEISMREVLVSFINTYASQPSIPSSQKQTSVKDLQPIIATRSDRRKALTNIIRQIEMIRDAEEKYKENMPENLKNSSRYESAEQAVLTMDEAIGLLGEVY